MSNPYAIVSALIFALVAVAHPVRIIKQWAVQVGSASVPMSVGFFTLNISHAKKLLLFLSPESDCYQQKQIYFFAPNRISDFLLGRAFFIEIRFELIHLWRSTRRLASRRPSD